MLTRLKEILGKVNAEIDMDSVTFHNALRNGDRGGVRLQIHRARQVRYGRGRVRVS